MKRIALSLGAITFVAAIAMSATGAFFSDSETSTGNTFTAGAIDLKVDSTQHYNGLVCALTAEGSGTYEWVPNANAAPGADGQPVWDGIAQAITDFNTANPNNYPQAGETCVTNGTWALKDLVPSVDKFFNFPDVKPGDTGEDTVSLHIDNNPAWACVDVTNIHNDDNTCNTPESLSTDPQCAGFPGTNPGANNLGELAQNMQWVVWNDNSDGGTGNNVLDAGETILAQGTGPLTNTTYALADSGTGSPLPGGATGYLGVAWCVGTFTSVVPGQPLVCDGTLVDNASQTDSYAADVGIRVVQARNNANFLCTPPTEGGTASLTVIKHVVHADGQDLADATIIASDFDMHVKNAGNVDVAGSPHIGAESPGFTLTGITPGSYTISENGPITVQGEHVDVSYSDGCASNTLNLVAGANTCTITNTYVVDPPQQP